MQHIEAIFILCSRTYSCSFRVLQVWPRFAIAFEASPDYLLNNTKEGAKSPSSETASHTFFTTLTKRE